MKQNIYPLAHQSNIVTQELKDEVLILRFDCKSRFVFEPNCRACLV